MLNWLLQRNLCTSQFSSKQLCVLHSTELGDVIRGAVADVAAVSGPQVELFKCEGGVLNKAALQIVTFGEGEHVLWQKGFIGIL